MELRVLRYFLAAAREKSLSKAAERLNVTQPTLSKQIADLEWELGKELFVRNRQTKLLELTDAGSRFFRYAVEIIALSDKAKGELTAKSGKIEGDVYIGAGESAAMDILSRAAGVLKKNGANVRYHIFSADAERVAERLDKGLLDFGLFVGTANIEKYDHIALPHTDCWGLIMSDTHPLSVKESISPSDLDGTPLFMSIQSLSANSIAGWYGNGFDRLNIAGTFTLMYNASVMAKNGLGCVVGIGGVIDTRDGSGLCFRPLSPRLELHLSLVWRRNWALSEAAAAFLDAMRTEIEVK